MEEIEMKMKTTLLTIAMLTVTGNMTAMGMGMGMGMETNDPRRMMQEMLPSAAIQSEAKLLYTTLDSLKIGKDGASIQVPANLLELLQNTLSVASTMTSEEGKKIEKLQLAYTQINCPWWRNELNEVMGNDKSFMEALAKFDKENRTYQMAWMTLREDAQGEGAKNANPSKELSDIITLDKSLHEQVTNLQTLFKNANKDLEKHIAKLEYLAKQNVQWILAFGMAINPEFAKTVTAETTGHLTEAVKALHTSPKVAALKKMQATAKK